MAAPYPHPGPMMAELAVRDAQDADSAGIVDLITRCYAEYPGCIMDLDGEERDLLTPRRSFTRFWVVERARDRAIVGTVACQEHRQATPAKVELKKLYLDPSVRRRGLARQLVALVEDHALSAGIARLELWSDTRFAAAHSVYAHLGYRHSGATRDLHDRSHTTELHYVKELPPTPRSE